jgi:hypothetical protein
MPIPLAEKGTVRGARRHSCRHSLTAPELVTLVGHGMEAPRQGRIRCGPLLLLRT